MGTLDLRLYIPKRINDRDTKRLEMAEVSG